jgi:hypothetical protein
MIEIWIWNIRALIMTGKNASILKKSWLNNALFTTNHKLNGRGSNPNLRGERPATNRLICLTAFFL